jgi:hypothetical protein
MHTRQNASKSCQGYSAPAVLTHHAIVSSCIHAAAAAAAAEYSHAGAVDDNCPLCHIMPVQLPQAAWRQLKQSPGDGAGCEGGIRAGFEAAPGVLLPGNLGEGLDVLLLQGGAEEVAGMWGA